MKRIRSCTIRGKRWHVKWESPDGDLGECDWDSHTLTINPDMDAPATADVMIHEYLHARWPDLGEDGVREAATEISAMLERADLIAED